MGELTEAWADVAGYEGRYQVSSLGRVRSLPRVRTGKGGISTRVAERILKPGTATNGYLFVILARDGVYRNVNVHRLVASALIPNPLQLPEVNHRNGNKVNNVVDNLEWVTRRQNVDHALRTGLVPTGSAHWRRK